MKTLHLTSPLMHGSNVSNAQHLLAKNAFGDFQPGKMDGQFGEATMRACKRAKYWLGYSTSKQLGTYGDQLDAYLSGKKKLPPAYRLRRTARLKAAAKKPLRLKALANAKHYLGQKENPPGSNRIAFASLWYGIIGPWCAMAVTRWYVDAGSKAFAKGSRYSYVPYIVHDARAGLNGLAVTSEPQPGDVVCFDWDRDGIADHVGLFDKWTAKRAGTFKTVEGNTAVGNDSNGGEVMPRDRDRSEVIAFVHVGR